MYSTLLIFWGKLPKEVGVGEAFKWNGNVCKYNILPCRKCYMFYFFCYHKSKEVKTRVCTDCFRISKGKKNFFFQSSLKRQLKTRERTSCGKRK